MLVGQLGGRPAHVTGLISAVMFVEDVVHKVDHLNNFSLHPLKGQWFIVQTQIDE